MATNRVTGSFIEVMHTGLIPNARVSSNFIEVLASRAETTPSIKIDIVAAFVDDAGLIVTPTIHLQNNIVAAFADDSGLIINGVDLDLLLEAPFTDDGGFSALPTIKRNVLYFARFMDETEFGFTITTRAAIPYITITANFADDAGFIVGRPPAQAPDKIVTANFTDEATLRARPTVVPVGGPFFFAWADEGATFEAAYGVINEDVFAFTIKQSEGDFAKATIVLRNPRVGLLSLGRKRWAFLSIKKDGVLKPLFYGRLIGLPSNIFEELVSIDFIARPFDFVERKAALASTMRTLPYWDGNFISPDNWDDDDTVLEARTANWHIDRVTHEVTISDLITAEEGTIDFTGTDYLYDSFSITLGTAPLRSVRITATFPWLSYGAGAFDISNRLVSAFGTGPVISSFTYTGLSGDWPKPGASIGDGWLVSTGSALVNVAFTAIPEAAIPWFYDASTIPVAVPEGSVLYPSTLTDGEYYGGIDGAGFNFNFQMTVVPIGYGLPKLGVSYDVERDMGQIVTFTMYTDVQDVLTLAPESDVKDIKLTSNSLSDYGFNGEVPIGDNRNRDYIRSVRGDLSLQYLMLVARANLVAATRVVNTTFQAPLMENLDLNLRMGAHLYNGRVPGGELVGKLTDYTMSLDGTTGAAIIELATSSSVGRGGAYEAVAGDPAYVDEGYVDAPYQSYRNVVALLPTGDITYTVPEFSPFDDGIDFRNFTVAQAVKQCFVQNTAEAQRAALFGITGADQSAVSSLLATIPTKVNLQLADLSTGPFIGTTELVVADLVIPKQIDLESAS